MSECLNCGKSIEKYTGRREKKYCSPACKQAYANKNQRKKQPKYVLLSTHETEIKKRDERIKLLEAQISTQNTSDDTKYQNDVKDAEKWTIKSSDENLNTRIVFKEPPTRMPGEDAIDFAIRKNEWKKLQK